MDLSRRTVRFNEGQGWLIRRLFEVWMHFTLLDPRLQVASLQ